MEDKRSLGDHLDKGYTSTKAVARARAGVDKRVICCLVPERLLLGARPRSNGQGRSAGKGRAPRAVRVRQMRTANLPVAVPQHVARSPLLPFVDLATEGDLCKLAAA